MSLFAWRRLRRRHRVAAPLLPRVAEARMAHRKTDRIGGAGWVDDFGIVQDESGQLFALSAKVRAGIAAQDRADYVDNYVRWLEMRAKGWVW